MIKQFLFGVLLLISLGPIFGQDYDQDYFRSPVNHDMRLSGSFAELRTNHFHMGIDIKSTNGRSGDKILAAAEGVISRINVDASGYGNALYIDHPNGYTTVYAHLSEFADTIANYIKSEQYRTKTFQQQLYPDSLFRVSKGDVIGKMGNTGKSFGPHLHFEIRETQSETPVNPFLFGLKPNDTRPPVFQAIKFYDSDSLGVRDALLEKKITRSSKNKYVLTDTLIKIQSDQLAIAVQVYDQMDGAYNKNGVYIMKMLIDNKVHHGYKLDKVSYEETHFINSFIDYREKQKSKRQFSNCFTHPVDQLSIYQHKSGRSGRINLVKGKPTKVKIVLQDFHGNESELSFTVMGVDKDQEKIETSGDYQLHLKDRNIIDLKNGTLIFEKETMVDNKHIRISEGVEVIDNYNLPAFVIGEKGIPLFKPYKLIIRDLAIVDSLKPHFVLIECDKSNHTAHRGIWQDSSYVVQLDGLGTFQCGFDIISPTIIPINLKPKMNGVSTIKFKISDNMDPSSKKDRLRYKASIDGKWVLFEYDLKNDLIFYKIDENCPPGEHNLILTVYDNRGNTTSFSYQFSNF